MKKLILAAVSAVFALALVVGASQAAEAPKGPIKIDNYGKKPAVTFEHSKHIKDIKCEQCHHTHDNDKGEHSCGKCHGAEDGKAPKLETAAHGKDKGVCYGCHRGEEAKKKLSCGGCHKG